MKKPVVAALALTIALSTAFSAGAASVNSQAEKLLQKMEKQSEGQFSVLKDQQTGVPTFVSGKLSDRALKNERDVLAFLNENAALFELDPSSDLTLVSQETDDLGMTHYTFEQSIQGVPVDGTFFAVHTDAQGYVKAIDGKTKLSAKKQFVGDTKVKVTEAEAIELAWKELGLTEEQTHGTEAEEVAAPEGHEHHHGVEDTAVKSELLIYANGKKAALAYRVQLQFIYPEPGNWQVYVDAKTGEILESYNGIFHGATSGYGYGVLGDKKSLNTYYYNGYYYLYDVTKSSMTGVIETRTAKNGTSLPGSYSVDSNNAFTATSQGADVDAHFYAGKVYDYYKATHGRNSYDNQGSTIRSTVHYSTNYNNAFWNGQQMVYGDGDGSKFIALSGALDIVAHELTHAVTEYTAGLEYKDQSGALNESMSDVFAVLVERQDYLVGEDVYTPSISGDALRSISNPPLYNQPDHMNDYVYTTSDNGGVHINSGIPNKAAYYVISSLGASKSEKIYYRALRYYLGPTSQFSDARAATLQAAADYYGSGSTEYNSVKNAWSNVGVY